MRSGAAFDYVQPDMYFRYHSEGSIPPRCSACFCGRSCFFPCPARSRRHIRRPARLGEDTFAPSRQDLLETRLERMSKTRNALDMAERGRRAGTVQADWAVGISWEYGRDELAEVLECIGGRAMAGICRMLAEEYRHRVSGVPDLMSVNPKGCV